MKNNNNTKLYEYFLDVKKHYFEIKADKKLTNFVKKVRKSY